MKGNKSQSVTFILWLLIATLSVSWITFSIIFSLNGIINDIFYQVLFIFSLIGFILSVIFIRDILTEVEYHITEENNKEKNIKDYYQYLQLLDPPDINN